MKHVQNNKRLLFGLVLSVFIGIFLPQTVEAANGLYGKRIAYRSSYRKYRAHRATRNIYRDYYDWDFTTAFTLDGLYYYGDVENRGFAMFNGPIADNFCGLGKFSVTHRVGNFTHMRYTIAGGVINGDNTKYADKMATTNTPLSYRNFHSWVVNGSVGVEIYPVHNTGFYLYAGFLFNYSNLNYTFWKIYHGKQECFLPMIPLEVGYAFRMSENWYINVHLGWTQGLCDKDGWSLDGFPHKHVLSDGTELTMGLPPSSYVNKMADGWFSLGITVSYTWQKKCITCSFH